MEGVTNIKGEGAHVPLDRENLTTDEFKVLTRMMGYVGTAKSAKQWREVMHSTEDPWNIRKIVAALSCLHGMDLIKSSQDERGFFTDEEQNIILGVSSIPLYWISKMGTPWYNRSAYTISNKGKLLDIKNGVYEHGLKLWPCRNTTKYTFITDYNEMVAFFPDGWKTPTLTEFITMTRGKFKVTIELLG